MHIDYIQLKQFFHVDQTINFGFEFKRYRSYFRVCDIFFQDIASNKTVQ